jgi:hypothetical protein
VAHAEVDQPRLLAPGNHLNPQPYLVLDSLDEVAAVDGLAHGAGGDGLEAVDVQAVGQRTKGG